MAPTAPTVQLQGFFSVQPILLASSCPFYLPAGLIPLGFWNQLTELYQFGANLSLSPLTWPKLVCPSVELVNITKDHHMVSRLSSTLFSRYA